MEEPFHQSRFRSIRRALLVPSLSTSFLTFFEFLQKSPSTSGLEIAQLAFRFEASRPSARQLFTRLNSCQAECALEGLQTNDACMDGSTNGVYPDFKKTGPQFFQIAFFE